MGLLLSSLVLRDRAQTRSMPTHRIHPVVKNNHPMTSRVDTNLRFFNDLKQIVRVKWIIWILLAMLEQIFKTVLSFKWRHKKFCSHVTSPPTFWPVLLRKSCRSSAWRWPCTAATQPRSAGTNKGPASVVKTARYCKKICPIYRRNAKESRNLKKAVQWSCMPFSDSCNKHFLLPSRFCV